MNSIHAGGTIVNKEIVTIVTIVTITSHAAPDDLSPNIDTGLKGINESSRGSIL